MSIRILIVDDDDILRDALQRTLSRRAGLAVDAASGVAQAGRLLASQRYDAVVSDEQMPDGLGHELLVDVARLQPWCRRVLASGTGVPLAAPIVWERFFDKADGVDALLAWARALTGAASR